jgi:hypothetical protein
MMSQLWKTGTLAAIGLAAVTTVAAQQPPPAAAPSSADKDKVVVTGCIQQAPKLPVGTTGGAATADTSKFILTKASPASDATATPKTYRLDAEDSQLTAHVGHKVEITGTLDASKPAAVAGDPAPPAAASPAKLKVASVKMIAASCSE